MVEDAEGVRPALNLGKISLLGHSYQRLGAAGLFSRQETYEQIFEQAVEEFLREKP